MADAGMPTGERGGRPRVAIIGAGFGGLGLACYLRRAGIESFTIYEKARDLGGVWRDNTYPGAACDVASHLYSFSFEAHYPWSRRYGPQAEILGYLRHIARRHGLERHMHFGCELREARWDESAACWRLEFADGRRADAEILVSAVGQLHRPKLPDIPGRDDFRGRAFHSARWDRGYDFRDRTVAVVGTGASAVQFVPEIAREARRVHVFQRSPGWVLPKFDRPYRAWERAMFSKLPILHDLDRWRIFWFYELVNSGVLGNRLVRRLVEGLARWHLRRQVADPALRARLVPAFPLGCKRTLLSNDWLPALARPNVELVSEAITGITPEGVRSADGQLRPVDAIVYATGFAASEFLAPIRVLGAGGLALRDAWRDGAEAYLGVAIAGFPNFFMLYGPNTNLGAGSIIYMLERQQRYLARCIARFRAQGLRSMTVREDAQRRFNAQLAARGRRTAFEAGCRSWYLGPDGRNTNNWTGYCFQYGLAMRRPDFGAFELGPTAPGGGPGVA
jgi:cation diffusion facilitator CzcD-associated flavoprotein CzcO